MKCNYMIIGAAKCATSTICTLLGQHPDVFMVECKEPHFFSYDEVYARGLTWYESLYDKASNKMMRGEGSNTYTMKEIFPETVSRIFSYAPDLKLIYIVRNPIRRIESFWLEMRSHGGEFVHYDFNTAVRINNSWLVDASNYWQQISAYRTHFPDEQIHVIFYEDFKADPGLVMRNCFKYLDVDPDISLKNTLLHVNRSSGKLVPKNTLSKLRSYLIFRSTVKLIPESIREPIKKNLFFREVKNRPQWHPETLSMVVNYLKVDTQKFLEFYGKSESFWLLQD